MTDMPCPTCGQHYCYGYGPGNTCPEPDPKETDQ